jgi:hypothetical protein
MGGTGVEFRGGWEGIEKMLIAGRVWEIQIDI